MNKFLFIIVVLLSQTVFSQLRTKEFSKNNYAIKYPDSWILQDNFGNGIEFFLLTKKTDTNDSFSENLNLIIQNIESLNLDLDKYVGITENQFKDNKAKVLVDKRDKNKFNDFHVFVFEANVKGNDLKFMQYIFVENNRAYVLTFSATLDNFDRYIAEMQKAMDSFTLK